MPSKSPKTTLTDVYSHILDSSKPRYLSDVVHRLKTTSRTFRDIDIGDDNKKKLKYDSTHFAYRGEYILEEIEYIYRINDLTKITYIGIPLIKLINFIINKDFVFIFNEEKQAKISFKKDKFYFDAIYMNYEKYSTEDWYSKCECSLIFKNLTPMIKIEKSYPKLKKNETLEEFMENEDNLMDYGDEAYYHQDIPFKVFNLVWKEAPLTKIIINSFRINNIKKNEGYIIISYK